MPDPRTEADARILIDEMLRAAAWDPADKTQVLTEAPVRIPSATARTREEPQVIYESARSPGALADPSPADQARTHRADYALLNQRGRPLAVIEAKPHALDPYFAKQQALPYAENLGAPFIFLSNGEVTYFWDWQNDDARIVQSLFSRADLERLVFMRENQKPLATIEIPEHYLRQGEARTVRPYQRDAMKALDHALEIRKRRFLLELPTGTGKTDLTCLYLKRLFDAERAKRVLILVDREQLARQAIEAIQDLLPSQSSYWLKAGMRPQHGMELTVCLLQTMISQYEQFTSGFFDVVVVDESHRSIYGAWRSALTHFDAFHIGLTATPASHIDRNTYRFYHCKDFKPDFSYPIQDAVSNGFLCGWKFAEGITQFIAEGVETDEDYYDPAEFERKWTNEDTNRKMMEEFDRLAHLNCRESAPRLPEGADPGKAIVFAITKRHAAGLTRHLNTLHPEANGRYAEVIVSDVADADQLIRRFKHEEFPKVAVSVDMLTTGFDCREVLHIVLSRSVRSRILYEQIRGRGTRTAPHLGKQQFVIYDFFRNRDFFEDPGTVDSGRGGPGRAAAPPPPPQPLTELGLEDRWLESVSYVEVGPEGERFDKTEYVSKWEDIVQSQVEDDAVLRKIRDGEPLSPDDETNLERLLNEPNHYFSEENLANAYEHTGTIIDFVRKALGLFKIKSREERLGENFQAWLVTKDFTPRQAEYLILLKNRGIARGGIDLEDLFQPPLSILNAAGLGMELFGEDGLREVIQEMNESVFPPTPARKQA